ncbi:Uncharacterised protein [Burkholderia pseudomallei]|nr:Uncharacterised protein [Burkholderia pseudomallei]
MAAVPPAVEPVVPPTPIPAAPTAPFPSFAPPLLPRPLPALSPPLPIPPAPAPSPFPPMPPARRSTAPHAPGAEQGGATSASGIATSASADALADTSAVPADIASCTTCNGADNGASSRDCVVLGAADAASCAAAYEPQQHANAAAASKVARQHLFAARGGCFVLSIIGLPKREVRIAVRPFARVAGARKMRCPANCRSSANRRMTSRQRRSAREPAVRACSAITVPSAAHVRRARRERVAYAALKHRGGGFVSEMKRQEEGRLAGAPAARCRRSRIEAIAHSTNRAAIPYPLAGRLADRIGLVVRGLRQRDDAGSRPAFPVPRDCACGCRGHACGRCVVDATVCGLPVGWPHVQSAACRPSNRSACRR